MILNGNGKLAKREITALEDSYLSFEGALAGQLLQNVDEVLQTRGGGQGLKLYSRLYNDPHIQAALNRLAGSVTCKDWIVAPGGEKRIDQKAADLVRSQLANLNAFDLSLKEENHSSVNGFDQLTKAMIVSGRLNGYVCAEVMWSNRDDSTVASEIRVRDPRQFGFMRGEQGYVLRHLTRENAWTGETPPLKKILVWSYGALDGSPYGRALGESIFWPHFFKRNIIKFNLKFLENYASPKVVGKYPRGSQTDQLATLNAAVNTIANETGISIPETMMLEYLQANASGTVDAYEKAIRYFDEQISEVILGETGSLSQSTGGGSRARDEVGAESGAMVAKAIADSLSSTFNRLARWITEFNLPQAMPPTVYRDFEAGEEITSRSGVDKTLFDLGYRLTPERVADVYGDGYEQAGGDDKEPALISSLGVGGVQALTGLLTQAATGQLPKENAIAVLVSVFGIAEEAAAKMVPDAPEQAPQTNPLDQLFGGQGDGNGSGNTGNGTGGTDGGNNPVGAGTTFSEDTESAVFAEQLRHPKGDPRGGQFASINQPNYEVAQKSVIAGINYTAKIYGDPDGLDRDTINELKYPQNFLGTKYDPDYLLPMVKAEREGRLAQHLKDEYSILISEAYSYGDTETPSFLKAAASILKEKKESLDHEEIKNGIGILLEGGEISNKVKYDSKVLLNDIQKEIEYVFPVKKGFSPDLELGRKRQNLIKDINNLPSKEFVLKFLKKEKSNLSSSFSEILEKGIDELDWEHIASETRKKINLLANKSLEFAETAEKDAAELIVDKARPLIQDAIAPWLTTITNFVEQSSSLEEIRDGLIDLFPEMDDAAFAQAMGQAMLLSDLAGRDEVLQDDADVAFAEAIYSSS